LRMANGDTQKAIAFIDAARELKGMDKIAISAKADPRQRPEEPEQGRSASALYCGHDREAPQSYPCDCPSDCCCKVRGNCGKAKHRTHAHPSYSAAFLCDHANECPIVCRCPSECYCKSHTCKSR
jgi:hypothetical protein